ncbi:MAG: DNA repair exonuclease [Lachnospiraceae bacterium]|nr:DNA repair exonuclease [Lachnospiraceae bacterium]
MKLIHCADLHLDSRMNANLDKEKARERKAEILHTFERMVAYAEANQVDAILIAGDLFDTRNISATTRNVVLHNIQNHPNMIYYYLNGNHDHNNFLSGLDQIPENLKLFSDHWTSYEMGNVVIWGMEFTPENVSTAHMALTPDMHRCNIVMLHGQEAESSSKDKAEVIPIRFYKNKGIDYLALGHVHAYKSAPLDARGVYCYPGCLEGRGFDECGEHGFVLLQVDEESGTFSHSFVPFAHRKLYTIRADLTGCITTSEMCERIQARIKEEGCDSGSLLKIVLCGALDVECEKDISYLQSHFGSAFYYVKVSDETTLKIDETDYLLDPSLKGEYVMCVMRDASLSEEDRKAIIRYGLLAIDGEEVDEA